MARKYIPRYLFGYPIGPCRRWFAWHPVRLFYGRWAWLETVSRQRIAKNSYLDGPDWEFWSYADKDAAP